jgi:holo-[acyl-carrier protein] synthase
VGIDITSVGWFARVLPTRAGQAMTRSCFTTAERDYCAGRPDRYAARWAGKEAVAKAIGTGFRGGLRPGHIEVLHRPDGRPIVAAPGTGWPNDAHRWRWAISLSHENDAAVAIAIATPTVGDSDVALVERSGHG